MSKEIATLKDFARMCKTIGNCEGCPIYKSSSFTGCHDTLVRHFDEANEIILKWCEEHPIKTYKSDFLEKFPNASLIDSGAYVICKRRVYDGDGCKMHLKCSDCWNEPMEEK